MAGRSPPRKKNKVAGSSPGAPLAVADNDQQDHPSHTYVYINTVEDLQTVLDRSREEAVEMGNFRLWVVVQGLRAALDAGSTFEETEVGLLYHSADLLYFSPAALCLLRSTSSFL